MSRAIVFLALALGIAIHAEGNAQEVAGEGTPAEVVESRRRGLWLNGGLGYAALGCPDCSGREWGVAGNLTLGGTVSRQVLLAASANWWSGPETDLISTLIAMTFQARLYASRTSNLYGLAGAGPALGIGSDTAGFGFAWIVGAGYDLALNEDISISPFVNWILVNEGTNFFQVGLSLTLH